jgi:rod shape-determining protein MreC
MLFSKKTMTILVVLGLVIIFVSITARQERISGRFGTIVISAVAPIQKIVAHSIRAFQHTWTDYFYLVHVAHENERLREEVEKAKAFHNRCIEIDKSNQRLRSLLDFKKDVQFDLIAAEVIARDSAPWIETITINKGFVDNVRKNYPVVVHEGIVGQVTFVTHHSARVLLLIDHTSAIDSLIRRTRTRGIIKGDSQGRFKFQYVVRKENVQLGDMVVSSGFDGVYPKGLEIGTVYEFFKKGGDMFQDVYVQPSVDFEKLEEVFVLCKPPNRTIHELED